MLNNPRIILHGNNFDANRGCQALRLTTQMILDRYLPGYKRFHANIFRNDDPQFHKHEPDPDSAGLMWETPRQGTPGFYVWGAPLLGSSLLGRFPAMKVHREIDESAAVIALGGDNLSFDYGFLASLLFFSPLHAAVQRATPSVIWAASIGPFTARPQWEKRFADVLKQVDLITVREPITQAYLESLGVKENTRTVSDLAFILPAEPTELPADIERALDAGAVGLNLAPLMKRYNNLSVGAWREQALAMLTEVQRKMDAPLVLIPHVMMSPKVFAHNDDFEFMRDLLNALPTSAQENVFLYDARNDSCKQIKWVISRLKIFAGSRTHSTIAALSSGVPTFCIGYSIKSRGINQDIFGHERWVAHIADLTAGQLVERLQDLLREEDQIRSHLAAVIPEYSQLAWKNGEYLKELLEQRGAVNERSA
jgi:colanic acid/amylovoran biosynthesis protein